MPTLGRSLSPQQRRIWLLEEISSESPFRVEARVRLAGDLDSAALFRALQTVAERNDILRTVFDRSPGETFPEQHCSAAGESTSLLRDLGELDEAEQSLALEEIEERLARACNDTAGSPRFQVALVRLGTADHVLLLTLSALCGDGRTLEHLMARVEEAYAGGIGERNGNNTREPLPFGRCVDALQDVLEASEAEAGAKFWRERMFAAPRTLKLPFETPPADSVGFSPRTLRRTLAPRLWSALRAHLALAGLSSEAILFAAWRILFWRLTPRAEVVLGYSCEGRVFEELLGALGPFDKCVPIALALDPEWSFVQAVQSAQTKLDEARDYQELFLWERLVDDAGDERLSPTYLPLTFEHTRRNAPRSARGVEFSLEHLDACIDRFDLGLSCEEGDGEMNANLRFNAELFAESDIEGLGHHLDALLESASRDPGESIQTLDLLTEPQRRQLLSEFNQTDCEAPSGICIHSLIQEQAYRTPDAPAVFFEDEELSYAQLNARANQLARYLRERQVGPGVFVGIHAVPSLGMVVAILAILKAGGAYLPLDPEYPTDRLNFMLQDTAAPVLLTQDGLGLVDVPEGVHVLNLDQDWDAVSTQSDDDLDEVVSPLDLAYSIYTSGSTGKPKGVLVTHANLVHSTHARILYYGGKVGRYLLLSSFAFDSSVAGIFWTLIDGGALVLPVAGTQRDPRKINELMARRQVTHSLCLASHYALILSQGIPEAFATLETAIVSGEVFSTAMVDRHDALAPNARLFNEYGPTEGSVWSIVFDCHDPVRGNQVPIGKPIANTQIYLLDTLLQPVPIGVPGEIYQGGAGVTNGYLNRPELTASAFVPNPFSEDPSARLYKCGDLARYLPDGNIEFLGRIDHQVKLRGYRIELGEIEAVLGKNVAIREVAVLCREDVIGEKRLVAYYACQPGHEASARELRERLAKKLPEYMVPAAFVQLDSLPRTSIGKLDTDSLEAPPAERGDGGEEYVAPRTPLEQVVTDVWSKELGIDTIGVNDDFFELGGHSLVAVRIVYGLRDILDMELPLRGIFDRPTVAGLVALLQEDPAHRARLEQIAQLAMKAASLANAEANTPQEEQIQND